MKFLKLKKYEVSVWNSMSQNTFHHIFLNLQLWEYCLQNKKRTSFPRKPTGHAGQRMRGAIFSFLPVFQFPFSSLIPSFVADHKLRPLLPFDPIPRALDRSFLTTSLSHPIPLSLPATPRGTSSLETSWSCYPGCQVDNLHSVFCSLFPIPCLTPSPVADTSRTLSSLSFSISLGLGWSLWQTQLPFSLWILSFLSPSSLPRFFLLTPNTQKHCLPWTCSDHTWSTLTRQPTVTTFSWDPEKTTENKEQKTFPTKTIQ